MHDGGANSRLASVELLGGLTIVTPRLRTTLALSTTQGVVLALLASRAGERVHIDELIEAAWPAGAPNGKNTLRVVVFRLRNALDPERRAASSDEVLVTHRDAYELPRSVAVDALEFERTARAGSAAIASGDVDRAAQLLGAAASMWGTPFGGQDHTQLSHFIRRLHQRHEDVRVGLRDVDLARGTEDLTDLERSVEQDRLDERRWGQLMVALARRGRQADALRAFQTARAHLVDEVGVEPGPQLRAIEQDILLQRDLGPIATVGGSPPRPSLAAAPHTHCVMRAEETALASELLQRTGCVTLVGPAGVGKTTIAAAVAAGFTHGECAWASLAEVAASDTWMVGVLASLGLHSQLPASNEAYTDVLASWIGDRPVLLVFDNAEHLADLLHITVERLQRSCRNLRVLVTSRRPLGLDGSEIPVRPFVVASLGDHDGASASCRYLMLRAGLDDAAAIPALESISRYVGGLPVGLEQAARMLQALSPAELVVRLESVVAATATGRPSLGSALDASIDLLTEAERQLLFAVSFLHDDWPLTRAEAVMSRLPMGDGAPLDLTRVATGVARLIELGLIGEENRTHRRVVESVRLRVRDRVTPEIAAFWRSITQDTICAEVSQLGRQLERAEQGAALVQLRSLTNDVREVAKSAVADGRVEIAASIMSALRSFWWVSGQYAEGQALYSTIRPGLSAWRPDTPTMVATRARALAAEAMVRPGFAAGNEVGDLLVALTGEIEDALDAPLPAGDRAALDDALAFTLSLRAAALAFTNDEQSAATAMARRALEFARRGTDGWLIARCLYAAAATTAHLDVGQTLDLLEQSTGAFEAAGDRFSAARVAMFTAYGFRLYTGSNELGHVYTSTLELCREHDAAPVTQLDCELGVAQGLHCEGDVDGAAEAYRDLVPRYLQVGELRCAALAQRNLAAIMIDHGDLHGASVLLARAAETFIALGEEVELAAAELHRARIALHRGHRDHAVSLLRTADELRSGSGVPMELQDARLLDSLLEATGRTS